MTPIRIAGIKNEAKIGPKPSEFPMICVKKSWLFDPTAYSTKTTVDNVNETAKVRDKSELNNWNRVFGFQEIKRHFMVDLCWAKSFPFWRNGFKNMRVCVERREWVEWFKITKTGWANEPIKPIINLFWAHIQCHNRKQVACESS